MWPERLDATIYSCSSKEIADKVRDLLKKKKISNDSIMATINSNSQLNLSIKDGKYSKGENQFIDSIKWVKGISSNINMNGSFVFVDVKEKLAPQTKSLDEAKGLVTADYQALLEKEWITSLRTKYPYKLDKDVLQTIK